MWITSIWKTRTIADVFYSWLIKLKWVHVCVCEWRQSASCWCVPGEWLRAPVECCLWKHTKHPLKPEFNVRQQNPLNWISLVNSRFHLALPHKDKCSNKKQIQISLKPFDCERMRQNPYNKTKTIIPILILYGDERNKTFNWVETWNLVLVEF